MKFGVLGPLAVTEGGESLNLGGPKQRTVLAMLIAHAGEVVSVDRLINAVYGEDAEPNAKRRIQVYVSTLRSEVGDAIVKSGSGWKLSVPQEAVDSVVFENMLRSGRDLVDDSPENAAELLREALSLWRGHAYADVEAHGLIDGEISRLAELRVAGQSVRIDADLACGRHAELIGEIEGLIKEHPYSERLRAQHMLALYRAGRQREALRAFGELRTLLINELGVDPTPELQELEQRILQQDESLNLTPRSLIQKRAILVADPGDPIELARMPSGRRDELLSRTMETLGNIVEGRSGQPLISAGSATYAVFDGMSAAASAAEQLSLQVDPHGLRIALDYGDVEVADSGVTGPPVSRAAVLVSVAHKGQTLLSADAHQAAAEDEGGAGLRFESLGRHELVGIQDPVAIYQLLVGDPPASFPPLETDKLPAPLPDGRDRSLPGYELREEIGAGAAGTLYRAYQPSVGREVIVEVIRRSVSSDVEFIRRFEADAQRLALLDHPNINPVLDYWRDTEGAYVVYRHHRGGTLATQPAADPMLLLQQVGAALGYAHSYGMVHGSLRPDRVFLDESGNGYLMGFPVSGREGQSSPEHPAYIAPEILEGKPPTTATDIYALGVLAYQLDEQQLPSDKPLEPTSEAIRRALSEVPSERFGSAAEFLAALLPSGGQTPAAYTETRNPYKGLAAFHETDAGDFFGREAATRDLVDAIADDHFVAVVGPSGVGKSSLVRAGLVPALRDGAIEGSENWLITDMFPGSHPFLELQRALERVAIDLPAQLRERLGDCDTNSLAGIDQVLPDSAPLLIVIDQFEELFTLTDQSTAVNFLDLIMTARDQGQVGFVITMRADFLDRPLLYSEFGQLMSKTMVALRSPNATELADAIRLPANNVGVEFEPAVVERIVREVLDRPGALPLMQYSLVDLFENRSSNLVTIDDHEELGGVAGALTGKAETTYAALSDVDRKKTKQVFLRLVTVLDDSAPTRRRIRVSALDDLDVAPILDAFARNRMVIFDTDPDTRTPTVEVAHEALLSQWPRLAEWIEDALEDLTMARRLDEAIDDWEDTGRDNSYLLSGGQLAQHVAWTTKTSLSLTDRETSFLQGAKAQEAALVSRQQRRRRLITAGFALAAVIASIFGVVALQQAQDSQANADQALANEQRALQQEERALEQEEAAEAAAADAEDARAAAETRALIGDAANVVSTDPQLAMMLALEGLSRSPGDVQAKRVIRDALSGPQVIAEAEVADRGDLSPDGSIFAVGGQGGVVEAFDVDSGTQIWAFDPEFAGPVLPRFVANGTQVAISEFDIDRAPPDQAILYLVDATTGEEIRRLPSEGCGLDYVFEQSLTGDEMIVSIVTPEFIATSGCQPDDTYYIGRQLAWFDLNSGDLTPFGPIYNGTGITATATVSSDESRLAIFDPVASRVTVEDKASGEVIMSLDGLGVWHWSMALSPDGSTLALGAQSGPENGEIRIVDVESGSILSVLPGHPGAAHALEFTDSGDVLVSAGGDGTIKRWRLIDETLLSTITGGEGPYRDISLSEDGSRILTLGANSFVLDMGGDAYADVAAIQACNGAAKFHLAGGMTVGGDRVLVSTICDEGLKWDRVTAEVYDPDSRSFVDSVTELDAQARALANGGRLVASQVNVSPSDTTPPAQGPVVLTDLETDEELILDGVCVGNNNLDYRAPECQEPPGEPSLAWALDLDFSPDGRWLAMGADAAPGRVWDLASGGTIESWSFYDGAFSNDGTSFVSISETERVLEVRETEGFSVISSDTLSFNDFSSHLQFLPDDETIVGVRDSGLLYYDADTLEVTRIVEDIHESAIVHMVVSQDGTMLATAGLDGFVRVWDVATTDLVDEIRLSEADAVKAVAFIEDDRHVMATTTTGPIRIFTLDDAELIEIGRNRLVRGFTDTECELYFPDSECPELEEIARG